MFFQFFYFKIEISPRNIIFCPVPEPKHEENRMADNNSQNPESKLDFAALYPSIMRGLPFWFGKNKNTPDPALEKMKNEIGQDFDRLDRLDLKELLSLMRRLRKLRDLTMERLGPGAFDAGAYGPPLPYAKDCEQIGKRINQ